MPEPEDVGNARETVTVELVVEVMVKPVLEQAVEPVL